MTIIGITETADSLSFSASAVLVLSSVTLLAFEKNFIRFHLYTCSGRGAPYQCNNYIIKLFLPQLNERTFYICFTNRLHKNRSGFSFCG